MSLVGDYHKRKPHFSIGKAFASQAEGLKANMKFIMCNILWNTVTNLSILVTITKVKL